MASAFYRSVRKAVGWRRRVLRFCASISRNKLFVCAGTPRKLPVRVSGHSEVNWLTRITVAVERSCGS